MADRETNDSADFTLITIFPDELLVEIFDQFLQISQLGSFGYPSAFVDTHREGKRLLASREPPTKVFESHHEILGPQVILLSVCKRWALVARSEPRLWRDLPLFGPAIKIRRFEPGVYPRQRTKQWSQFNDIGFYYKFPSNDVHEQEEHWRMFDDRASLAQSCPLHLHLFLGLEQTGTEASGQFFSRLRQLMPRTSALTITCRDPVNGLYPLWEDLPFATLPSAPLLLNTVVFSQYFPPESVHKWVVAQLTKSPGLPSATTRVLSHAFLQEMGTVDVVLLLSTIKGLISLQTGDKVYEYTVENAVTHDNLQELCLGGEGWATLVPYLTLPALVHLEIGDSDEWPSPEDIAFFKRSGCPLKTFMARHVDYTTDEFADFLLLVGQTLEHYRLPMVYGWTPYKVWKVLSKRPPPRLLTGDFHVMSLDLHFVESALRGVLTNEAYTTGQGHRPDVQCGWSWCVYIYVDHVVGDGSSYSYPELDDLHGMFVGTGVTLRVETRTYRPEEHIGALGL